MERFLNDREVAAMTGMSVQTLRNWRGLGRGPRYVRPGGRAIRYKLSDVMAFMEEWAVSTECWSDASSPKAKRHESGQV